MKPEQTPFPPGWLSFDLPGYRGCDGTYCFYPYEELPPLDPTLSHGDFHWLPDLEKNLQEIMDIHKQVPGDKLGAQLVKLMAEAKELGLQFPESFVKFMSTPYLQDQIPSCTACYFDLPEQIVKSPIEGDEGYLVRFLNDQQDVLLWYLYLRPDGDHAVIVSSIYFDEAPLEDVEQQAILNAMAFCAESFEEFLYRFWLENTLWFSLSDGEPLTDEQQNYVTYLPVGE